MWIRLQQRDTTTKNELIENENVESIGWCNCTVYILNIVKVDVEAETEANYYFESNWSVHCKRLGLGLFF